MDWTTHKPIEIEMQAKALPFLSAVDRTDGGISWEPDYIPETYLSYERNKNCRSSFMCSIAPLPEASDEILVSVSHTKW